MRPVENRTPNRGPVYTPRTGPRPQPVVPRPPAPPRSRVELLLAAAEAIAQQRAARKCYAELSISGPADIRALADFYHGLPSGMYSVRGNGQGYSRFIATISWKSC